MGFARRLRRRLLALLAAVAAAVLLADAAVYLLLSFSFCIVPTPNDYRCRPSFGLISKPMARFNRETGYKWTSGDARIVRVTNGEVVYDNVFSINNAGYHSARDYVYEKAGGVYRIVVLGDSFTNEVHQRPWPEKLNELLPERYEIYAFGIDGGGAANWHGIFFNEIVPRYDFDAVVVASYVDNLGRKYAVFHSTEDALFFGRFDKLPRTHEEFARRDLPRMANVAAVVGDEEIDDIAERIQKRTHSYEPLRLDFYMTKYLYRRARKAYRDSKRKPAGDSAAEPALVTVDQRLKKLPKKNLRMLKEIVEYCRTRDMPVVLSPIPERGGLARFLADGGETLHQEDVRTLGERLETLYFDGYEVFRGIEPEEIYTEYWLKYDGHWGQKASDLYARELSKFIVDNIP